MVFCYNSVDLFGGISKRSQRGGLENRLGASPRGFESLFLRQSKPKSNTKVFGLGFSFAKIQVLSAFLTVGVPSFQFFRGSYWCVRIALSVAFADGFMPRKVLDVRKECVRLSCQRQTKSPFGAVGWRFICLSTRS